MKKTLLLLGLIALLTILAAQCSATPAEPEIITETVIVKETVQVEVEKEVVVTKEVEVEKIVEVTPEPVPYSDVPFQEMWASSAHANAEAEAFNHWNEDDPAEVPTACAKCHSTPGYLDFLGVDGTAAGVVDNAAEIGTVVTCMACHNDTTQHKTSVVFPSGVEVTGLGDESRCMECHQGRASTASVDGAIEKAGLTDMDTISEDLGFTNIHYFAAAATQAGGTAMGGYQYAGKAYDARFAHVDQFDTCVGCHDSHTLQVKVEECTACHEGVTAETFRDIRMAGSLVDYDGDGDMDEGIAFEIEGLQAMLMEAIQAYANDVAGTPIVYDVHSYPYFFIDTNANGSVDEGEAAFPNKYASWTGRLAKAAYNYQTSIKDPGAFAHGGKYIIQLLYDSIEDLNTALPAPVDLSKARRIDHGHFAGSEEAFRHWDEDGEVPASCSKCHSATGLPLFLKEGVNISEPTANGFLCETCHVSITEEDAPRHEVTKVEFPSGLTVDAESSDPNSLLCMNCHQGRESTVSVNKVIEGLDLDTVSDKIGFRNVHYFAAGATRYGTQAQGTYEYAGQTYEGFYLHAEESTSCIDCHGTHTLTVKVEACAECHAGIETEDQLADIRLMLLKDYDGDGDAKEGIAGEVATMRDSLYEAIQAYAADTAGTPIIYDAHSYPYFFVDTDGNGNIDEGEVNYGNKYATWTPRLLQAAYNYQYATKDPGAFTHNPKYIMQILYDSINDIGGDVSGMIRP